MLRGWVTVIALGLGLVALAGTDDELEMHLELLLPRLEDPRRDLEERERLALEVAGTLDRTAQVEASPEKARARWDQAVALLDRFNRKNPGHPEETLFAVQAAVYLWAEAQSALRRFELAPADAAARSQAATDLDAARERLRPLVRAAARADDPTSQNARFRLAQALADRAKLEEEPEARRALEAEALSPLEQPITESTLQGFALLLRAELLERLGRHDEAQAAYRAAEKAKLPPPEPARLDVLVQVLTGKGEFEEAEKVVHRSTLDDDTRSWLNLRIKLARWAALPDGPNRADLETEIFRQVEALRKPDRPESRRALLALARTIHRPGPRQEPAAWDTLAEGRLLLGDPGRAGELTNIGAKRAEALDRHDQAIALRYRAGAMFYQAGQFDQAEILLERVATDPRAGDLRPRAGLLRALTLGRKLARGASDADRAAYRAALETQIRDFPNDPTTAEARWLLGQDRLAAGDRAGAEPLWEAIPPDSPRWLDAQQTLAALRLDDLDSRRIDPGSPEAERRLAEARRTLVQALKDARDPAARVDLRLALSRLELSPGLGQPDAALDRLDRLAGEPLRPDRRAEVMRLRVVALAQSGQFLEADRATREQVRQGSPTDLLTLARDLDRSAQATDSDPIRRRYGDLLLLLTESLLAQREQLDPAGRIEALIRRTRALMLSGNTEAARGSLTDWPDHLDSLPASLLPAAAEALDLLGEDARALAAYRLLARRARPGSLPWFEARLGVARASARSGQVREARRLLDGTSILYPNLGGEALKARFDLLRRQLDHP